MDIHIFCASTELLKKANNNRETTLQTNWVPYHMTNNNREQSCLDKLIAVYLLLSFPVCHTYTHTHSLPPQLALVTIHSGQPRSPPFINREQSLRSQNPQVSSHRARSSKGAWPGSRGQGGPTRHKGVRSKGEKAERNVEKEWETYFAFQGSGRVLPLNCIWLRVCVYMRPPSLTLLCELPRM